MQRAVIQELIKLADSLDKRGLRKDADIIDSIIKKSSDLSTIKESLKQRTSHVSSEPYESKTGCDLCGEKGKLQNYTGKDRDNKKIEFSICDSCKKKNVS